MKREPMRFCGVSWPHNPRVLRFSAEKTLVEQQSPGSGTILQETGRRALRVEGEGELYGENCVAQFGELLTLFRTRGAGVLSVAGLKPFYAVFEELRLLAEPKPDVLTYRFVFREAAELSEEDKPETHVIGNGESLWDVSYLYGIGIDRLVELNPQVRRPDEVAAGEEVRLC